MTLAVGKERDKVLKTLQMCICSSVKATRKQAYKVFPTEQIQYRELDTQLEEKIRRQLGFLSLLVALGLILVSATSSSHAQGSENERKEVGLPGPQSLEERPCTGWCVDFWWVHSHSPCSDP